MNYYENIKEELINNELNKKVKTYSINRSDLDTYYNVGKMLAQAGKHYGEGIIKEYSRRLTKELGKGYSKRNLWLILKFYELKEKVQTLSAQLSWSHYCELLSLESINEIDYYIKITELNSLSVRQLRYKIKNHEYERLPEETKRKLITREEIKVEDLVKNPILIKNPSNYENIKEELINNELNKKYDLLSLNKMKKFYYLIEKMATMSPLLSYSHYVELLPYDDINKIRYYIKIVEERKLSIRQLRERIKSKEYERLPDMSRMNLFSWMLNMDMKIIK